MSIRKREWESGGKARVAWVVDYKDQSGKRRLKTFPTQKAAKTWWEGEGPREVQQGTHTPDSASLTVAEAAEIWIDAAKAGRGDRGPAEASTLRQYRYHVDRYIVPKIGRTKLSRLTQARVMAFRDQLLKDVSRPLAKKVLASLKGILSEAQHRGLVGINMAANVKIGNSGRHREKVVIPTIAEIKAILAKLDDLAGQADETQAKHWRRWRGIVATAIHTGMRASEVRGLPWDAIDLKAGKIEVYQRADETGQIGPPKSASSRRTINIPAGLVSLLRAWKLECPAGGLVFPNGAGNPESLANIYNRAWKPALIAAGVADAETDEKGKTLRDEDGKPILHPRYNFHSLRHFHASMLIADGANPKEVQVEMGHSSIQITYDLYGHLFQDEEADKARRERANRLAVSLA